MTDDRDETLLGIWAVSKGVELDKPIAACENQSMLQIYRSARGDTSIDMRHRLSETDMMKAFCTLLFKKFFNQLNRKLKVPKTVGINGIDAKSLEELENDKDVTVTKTTFKIVRRVVKLEGTSFIIGSQTVQNYIGCGFFPIGFATKLFIFEALNGAIYVPRMAKVGGKKVIAFAEKIQEGYDFNRSKAEETHTRPMQTEPVQPAGQPAGQPVGQPAAGSSGQPVAQPAAESDGEKSSTQFV